ncbi:tubulin-like doman-containing protein [Halobaculum sp. EA56]|uniref:tubulin-like doman-containing protein n=1 Tax=Halobaculum sp. EA56 TaxID=3421648 RepID=UPI003EB90E89
MSTTTHKSRLDTTPTIVIAIGDSGIRDAREIYHKAKKEGVADQLLVIWINSRSEFPEHDADGIRTFRLEKPGTEHIERDREARAYVSAGREIRDIMGAKRWREVARYYLDTVENISRLEGFIETRITRFMKEFLQDQSIKGPDAANVILTAGAGGGTGSGGIPMISAMVDTITDELSADGALSSVNFHLWGIVSVATVDNTVSNGPVPDVKPRYLSNTAALLSELRAMAGQGDASYPLEIPLVSAQEGATIRRDSYTIEENPFDGVYLVRYVQNHDGDVEAYRRGVNRTAAAIAYRWMRQDLEQDDVENAADDLNSTFFEARAVTFEAPTDVINELFEERRRIESRETTLEQLTSTRDNYRDAAQQIQRLQSLANIDLNLDESEVATAQLDTEEGEPVEADGGNRTPPRQAHELALKTANSITPGQVSEELIEDRVETVQIQLTDKFHDAVPANELIAAVTLSAIVDTLAETREDHAFPEAVRDFVDSHIDALEQFNGAFDQTAPVRVLYSEIVRPFLKDRLSTLRSKLDATTPIVDYGERSTLKQKIANTEQTLERLDRLNAEHRRIVEALESTQERLVTARESLREVLETFHGDFQSVQTRIESTETKLRKARSRSERLRSELLNPSMGRSVTFPVVDPEQLDPSMFEGSPGLAKLVREGVIDQDRAAANLNTALRAEEGSAPLDDKLMTESGARSPARGRPIVFASDDAMDPLWANAAASDSVTATANSEFSLAPKRITHQSTDELTILVEYGDIHFENFLHPVGADAIRDGVSDLVGLDVDLRESVAYHELLGLEPQPDSTDTTTDSDS